MELRLLSQRAGNPLAIREITPGNIPTSLAETFKLEKNRYAGAISNPPDKAKMLLQEGRLLARAFREIPKNEAVGDIFAFEVEGDNSYVANGICVKGI